MGIKTSLKWTPLWMAIAITLIAADRYRQPPAPAVGNVLLASLPFSRDSFKPPGLPRFHPR